MRTLLIVFVGALLLSPLLLAAYGELNILKAIAAYGLISYGAFIALSVSAADA